MDIAQPGPSITEVCFHLVKGKLRFPLVIWSVLFTISVGFNQLDEPTPAFSIGISFEFFLSGNLLPIVRF